MLSMLYVRLTIKVKVGIPESFKVAWYRHKITGSSHLKRCLYRLGLSTGFTDKGLSIVSKQVRFFFGVGVDAICT